MAAPRAKKTTVTLRTQPVLPVRKHSDRTFKCHNMTLEAVLKKVKEAGGDPSVAKLMKENYYGYGNHDGVNCTYGVPESDESYNKRLIEYEAELAEYRLWVQTVLPGILIAQQAATATQLEALEVAASAARAKLNNC